MLIQNYTTACAPQFLQLFTDYFMELDGEISREVIHQKLVPHILGLQSRGLLHICLGFQGEDCMGFSLYQIDTPESDWCKRPGWGIIREFYIAPPWRSRGFGTTLAKHSEAALRSLGAQKLYLTADDALAFWQHCGWEVSPETASNGLVILEK